MVKRITMTILYLFFAFGVSAQAVNEVTLVVSADGTTKANATNVALRSAIEQAFGVFVSANTTILNDELTKDEIVAVSSGNIQKYTEVASMQLPNGNISVTLQATVSVQKLVAYAQSKGSECEFAGATFGANLKLIELNKQNEAKAIDNLLTQLEAMVPYVYDYELQVSDPKANGNIKLTVIVKSNDTTKAFGDLITSTLNALSLTEAKAAPIKEMGIKLYGLRIKNVTPPSNNKNYNITLWSVKTPFWSNPIPEPVRYLYSDIAPVGRYFDSADKFGSIFTNALYNFTIEDNVGGVYVIAPQKPRSKVGNYTEGGITDIYLRGTNSNDDWFDEQYCWGIQQGFIRGEEIRNELLFLPFNVQSSKVLYTIEKTFNIPVDRLMKISGFKVNPKNR